MIDMPASLETLEPEQIERLIELHRLRYERVFHKARRLTDWEGVYEFSDVASLVRETFEKDPVQAITELEKAIEFPFKKGIKSSNVLVLKGPEEEEIFGWGNAFYIYRPEICHRDSLILTEMLPIREDVEIAAIPLIINSRIKIRDQLALLLMEQNGRKIIDLTRVDNYSSTQQAINYTIATENPDYKIRHDEANMIYAMAKSGKFEFDSEKIVVYCFSCGTGLRELVTLKTLMDRWENKGKKVDVAVRFVDRSDWSRFAETIAKDRKMNTGRDLAAKKDNSYNFSDVGILRQDICTGSVDSILEQDSAKYLQEGRGVLLLSLNSLVGFSPELQDRFVTGIGDFCDRHRDKEVKALISLTTQRDLFDNLGLVYKLKHKIKSKSAGIPNHWFRKLPREMETDYRGIDLRHFINYTIDELLLFESRRTEFAVWQDVDEHRNQRYNIGAVVLEETPLGDQYGNPLVADGKQVSLKQGTRLLMHQSTRFNYKRICDLTHKGHFAPITTDSPQAALWRG